MLGITIVNELRDYLILTKYKIAINTLNYKTLSNLNHSTTDYMKT